MKRNILILFITLSCGYNCNPKTEFSFQNQAQLDEAIENLEDNQTYFERTLHHDNLVYQIVASGEGSMGQLLVKIDGLTEEGFTTQQEIEGIVVQAEIGDLNNDGYRELLVYTQSAGSGSYGNVIGFSIDKDLSVKPIVFPTISINKKLTAGYMGHDSLYLEGELLVQEFPLYQEHDDNLMATGGKRKIYYKLTEKDGFLVFQITNLKELGI